MADPPPYPDTEEDAGEEAERGAATGKRGWLGILVIAIAIALVVLIVVLHLTGTLGPGSQ